MSVMVPKMMSTTPAPSLIPTSPPVRTIPGGYGWPLVGPISDRLDYFWFQGPEKFFRKRIDQHKSTVFRTNVPPSFPFFTGVNPNVVAVLDCKSFSHLFDTEIADKKNVLLGEFMPSLSYTGDVRVCAYLDTSEPRHRKIKGFALDLLKRSSTIWVPTLISELDTMWDTLDSQLSTSGSANYLAPITKFSFAFFTRALIGADLSRSPEISDSGYIMAAKWLGLQVIPTINIGVLQPLEEIFLHSFPYPAALVGGGYNKIVNFIESEGKDVIQRGETEFELTKHDTIHNLMFILSFNAFGGFAIFFRTLLTTLGSDTTGIQEKLRKEVREKCKSVSELSFDSVSEMELVQSYVYETLRLNPTIPSQYARARKDFELSSHDSVYQIRKGELLCGYQPLVMRDPKVFDDPETFVSDRFTGEKGKELLNYLFWSNGPQTGSPSESNKQCPAKDQVTLSASLFLAHVFLRYDSVTCSSGSVTALEKAKMT